MKDNRAVTERGQPIININQTRTDLTPHNLHGLASGTGLRDAYKDFVLHKYKDANPVRVACSVYVHTLFVPVILPLIFPCNYVLWRRRLPAP